MLLFLIQSDGNSGRWRSQKLINGAEINVSRNQRAFNAKVFETLISATKFPSPDYLSARFARRFFFLGHADFFLFFPPMRSLVPGWRSMCFRSNQLRELDRKRLLYAGYLAVFLIAICDLQ